MKKGIVFLTVIILVNFIFPVSSFTAPYPIENKPKIKINVEIQSDGDLIYRGIDLGIFEAPYKGESTGDFKLMGNKAKRILTNKTEIELDLGEGQFKYDALYKVGYRVLYSKAGTDADKVFASESGDKDGWHILKSSNGEDLIIKIDDTIPTFVSGNFSGNNNNIYITDKNCWIKKGSEVTISINGQDKPSGIKEEGIKIGTEENKYDIDTGTLSKLAEGDINIYSATFNELNNGNRQINWKAEGLRNSELENIFIKFTDYGFNKTDYIDTGYKIGVDGKAYVPQIEIQEIDENRRKVTITAEDMESGVERIRYRINLNRLMDVSGNKAEFIIDLNDYKGQNTIPIEAVTFDNVGNTSDAANSIIEVNYPPEIILNFPDNGEFGVKEKPRINVTLRDSDNDKTEVSLICDGVTIDKIENVNNGETVSPEIPEDLWFNLKYYNEYTFEVIAKDKISSTSKKFVLKKINTTPNININKPTDSQYVYQGYIPFEWEINEPDNQEYGNASLKVYTDTPNTYNNGVMYDGNVENGTGNLDVFYYLPEGIHNIFFEITDGKSEPVIKEITVKVNKMVNINLDNGNKTFYIADFDKEKSAIYYNDINNRLNDGIYMLNILSENGDLNEEYIKNIQNIKNVTGKSTYLKEGDKIYTKSGIDSAKITDWIFEKISKDFSVNKVIKVTDSLNTDIIFQDEEKDYTTTNPDRGKNRRFQIFHIPTYYDSPDNEIKENGRWIYDEDFDTFDGESVIKENESISLKINKAGKYILNILEDDDIQNNYGKDFSKSSPDIDYVFYAHRPPKAIIGYEENADGTTVKLISDDSYDPDFVNSKPNKGIKEVKWEYRELTYENDIITDWTEVPDINNFSVNPEYKTYLRLTVKDFGGLKDVDDVLILEGTETLVFDKTGLPPKADFSINVGKTPENSVDSRGFVYKGKDGKETVQLKDKILWNDFFAENGTRVLKYTKNAVQLNNDVKSGIKNLSTTLDITNKFNLNDSITKDAVVKEVYLENKTQKKILAGSNANIKIVLNSEDNATNWGDFIVKISSTELGTDNTEMKNETTNVFVLDKRLPETLKDRFNYTVDVYSRRTGELLTEETFGTEIETYLTVDADVDSIYPLNEIPAGAEIDIVNIETRCPVDVEKLELALYKGNTPETGIITLKNKDKIRRDGDKIIWKDVNDFVISSVGEGIYTVKIFATAKNGDVAEWEKDIRVIDIKISGEILPNPAMAGDEIIFTVKTEGYADKIEIIFPKEIIEKDNVPGKFNRTGKYSYPLIFNVDGKINKKTNVFRYITSVEIDKTFTFDNVRMKNPYEITIRAYKGKEYKDIKLKLDVRRSVLDLIKPGIKDKKD